MTGFFIINLITMNWQEVKKTAVETGERIIGRGEQVKFRHNVEALVKRGYTQEAAENTVFANFVSRLNGQLNFDSQQWRSLNGAFSETIQDQRLRRQMLRDAEAMPLPAVRADAAREVNIERYLQNKYHEQPNIIYIVRMSECNGQINSLAATISREIPRAMRRHPGSDLEAILRAEPNLGAAIGQLHMLRQRLETIENECANEIRMSRALTELENHSLHAMREIFLAPFEEMWTALPIVGKSTIFEAAGRMLRREFLAIGRVFIDTARVGNAALGMATRNKFRIW